MSPRWIGSKPSKTASPAKPPEHPVVYEIDSIKVAVIINALRRAWQEMVLGDADGSNPVAWMNEKDVTRKLAERLNIMRSGGCRGFTDWMFETVVVDAKFPNFDGVMPDKMPDLTFRIRGMPKPNDGRYGLFVEAKVVGDRNRRVSHYVESGIRRFVTGDYAWAMRNSLMVAYVLDGSGVPDALDRHFGRSRAPRTVDCAPQPGQVVPETLRPLAVHHTRHARQFSTRKGPPGAIDLVHLWLPCPVV